MQTIARRVVLEKGHGAGLRRLRLVAAPRLRRPRQTVGRGYVLRLKAELQSSSDGTESDNLVRDALRQINNYCIKLDPESEVAIDCWDAYNYFASEAVAAEQECSIESPGNLAGQACNNFLQWERFVREVESAGGVKQMVKTILAVKNAKERNSTSPVKTPSRRKSSIVPVSDILGEYHTRQLCQKLFDLKDSDKDGRINVEEFRTLMKLLGDEVHGETISVMFEALDIHGSLDFDEFFTILEAESIRSHSPTAGMLRSTQKHGHSNDIPKWIDNV